MADQDNQNNANTVPMKMKSKLSDVKLPVLRQDNYVEWKIKITSLLKAKELFTFVESPPTKEERAEPELIK